MPTPPSSSLPAAAKGSSSSGVPMPTPPDSGKPSASGTRKWKLIRDFPSSSPPAPTLPSPSPSPSPSPEVPMPARPFLSRLYWALDLSSRYPTQRLHRAIAWKKRANGTISDLKFRVDEKRLSPLLPGLFGKETKFGDFTSWLMKNGFVTVYRCPNNRRFEYRHAAKLFRRGEKDLLNQIKRNQDYGTVEGNEMESPPEPPFDNSPKGVDIGIDPSLLATTPPPPPPILGGTTEEKLNVMYGILVELKGKVEEIHRKLPCEEATPAGEEAAPAPAPKKRKLKRPIF